MIRAARGRETEQADNAETVTADVGKVKRACRKEKEKYRRSARERMFRMNFCRDRAVIMPLRASFQKGPGRENRSCWSLGRARPAPARDQSQHRLQVKALVREMLGQIPLLGRASCLSTQGK